MFFLCRSLIFRLVRMWLKWSPLTSWSTTGSGWLSSSPLSLWCSTPTPHGCHHTRWQTAGMLWSRVVPITGGRKQIAELSSGPHNKLELHEAHVPRANISVKWQSLCSWVDWCEWHKHKFHTLRRHDSCPLVLWYPVTGGLQMQERKIDCGVYIEHVAA